MIEMFSLVAGSVTTCCFC